MSLIHYRYDIDGLRALAVIPVVLFHLNANWIPGGYVGVDIFFVISGFLITSILLKDLKNQSFSFRNFWIRRIKRIVPAMTMMISISIGIGGLILLGSEWKLLAKQAVSAALSFANIFMWQNTQNYWGSDAENLPLLHTWSLSIEEQFYLLFPIGLFLLYRCGRKWVSPILAIIFLASLALCIWGTYNRASASFYLLPTRAWELLAGCLLAVYIHEKRETAPVSLTASKVCSNLGIVILLVAFFAMDDSHFPGFKAIFPVLGSTLIIFGGHDRNADSLAKRLLSFPAICYIGRISYSLYLWHWPLIVFARDLNLYNPWLIFTASMITAIGSYHWVESPTRRIKDAQVFRRITMPAVLLLITMISLPFFIKSGEIPFNTPNFRSELNILKYRGETTDPNILHNKNNSGFQGDIKTGLWPKDESIKDVDVLVLGDSHSTMWMPAIIEACKQNDLIPAYYGAGAATSPFWVAEESDPEEYYFIKWTPDTRREFDEYRQRFIEQNKPQIIVICARWDWYIRWTKEKLFQHLDQLRNIAPKTKILIIGQPPVLPFGGFSEYNSIRIPPFGKILEPLSSQKNRQLINHRLQDYCTTTDNFYYFETEPFYKKNETLALLEGKTMFYFDDDHLSIDGAMRIADKLGSIAVFTDTKPK